MASMYRSSRPPPVSKEHEMLEEASWSHFFGDEDRKWQIMHSLARRVSIKHEREALKDKGIGSG